MRANEIINLKCIPYFRHSTQWMSCVLIRHIFRFVPQDFLFLIFFNVYLFLRERQSVSRRGAEIVGDTIQGSELSAQSPRQGSNSRAMRSLTEPKSNAQPTEPPGCPYCGGCLKNKLTTIYMIQHSLFWVYNQRKWIHTSEWYLCSCVHCSIIYNSQDMETMGAPGWLSRLSLWLQLRS